MCRQILRLSIILTLVTTSTAFAQDIDFTGTVTHVTGATPNESYDTGGTLYTITSNYPSIYSGNAVWNGDGGFVVPENGSGSVDLANANGVVSWGPGQILSDGSIMVLGAGVQFEENINLGSDPTATRQIDLGVNGEGESEELIAGQITGDGGLVFQDYSQTAPVNEPEPPFVEVAGISITGQLILNNVNMNLLGEMEDPTATVTASKYQLSGASMEADPTGTINISLTNSSEWNLNSFFHTDHYAENITGDATSAIDFGGFAPTNSGGTVTLAVQSGNFAGELFSDSQYSGVSTELIKVGTGTFVLSGNNTTFDGVTAFTGATDVKQGTLLVTNTSGSATGTGSVTIESGATLGGTGRINASSLRFQSGAHIDLTAHDPANPPASPTNELILDCTSQGSSVVFNPGVTFAFDLGANDQSDQLDLLATGRQSVIFNDNSVDLNFLAGAGPGTYRLFDFSGFYSYSGTLQNGANYYFDYSVNSISVTVEAPEPSTGFYLVAGLLVVWGTCRRRARSVFAG